MFQESGYAHPHGSCRQLTRRNDQLIFERNRARARSRKLSAALLWVPWNELADAFESRDLSSMQRALLPTLVGVNRQMADTRHPLEHPENTIAAALTRFSTTPGAIRGSRRWFYRDRCSTRERRARAGR